MTFSNAAFAANLTVTDPHPSKWFSGLHVIRMRPARLNPQLGVTLSK
jgi:hypothetical protein